MKRKFILFLITGLAVLSVVITTDVSFGQNVPMFGGTNTPTNSSSSGNKSNTGKNKTTGSTNGESSNGFFGGKITKAPKSTKITETETGGYTCNVLGTSITIKPIGAYPTDYLIPVSASKTAHSGQWILGLYKGTTTITCPNKDPLLGSKTVTLPTITVFGTSK